MQSGQEAITYNVDAALSEIWGYPGFRPHQREAVQQIMAGGDSLTVLPTGGGKSLCYQLPASLMVGTAVVVSPLISLMADQVNGITLLGVPAAFINSSQKGDEVRRTKAAMFAGELKLLYVSPERLMLDHFLEELRTSVKISFFAIDEAHCISQWGHDFRPEYKQLSRLREAFPGVGVHAFTATAPPELQTEIISELRLKQPFVQVGSYYRPNLTYRTFRRDNLRKQLLKLLRQYAGVDDNGIIYCLTRKETDSIAEFLVANGFSALPYHAGMSAEQRKRNQDMFQQEKVNIIVATVAFGMGIDQSNVRFVIHTGLPRTISHYQQEAGRAGRDGLRSQCILIHAPKDILFWRRIIEEERAMVPQRMEQLRDMINYASQIKCRHKTLVEYFGQPFLQQPCDGCDVCAGEVESIPEARDIARKIISAVLKLRQNFGGVYIAQVLTGSKEAKVIANGHNHLSVFDLLGKFPKGQVLDWINQLEGQGYLLRSSGEYPVIGVSTSGYWLLLPEKYGKTEAELAVVLVDTQRKESKEKRKVGAEVKGNFDRSLFGKLRQVRAELAAKLGVPAFVVFGDKSLQDMAEKKPLTREAFLEIFGVGKAKLDKFGGVMLRIIAEHQNSPK